MDKSAFLEDDKTQSAIVFQLLIVGEAVKRLSPDLRSQHPDIPWSLIARMRDNLIHRYDDREWMSIKPPIQVRVSDCFDSEVRQLAKRYRRIRLDIQPIIN
jgi:uncharacterized protein with HEPN domain